MRQAPDVALLTDPGTVGTTTRARSGWQAIAAWSWTVLPPVVACALVRGLISLSSGVAFFGLRARDWARWDSGNYVTIVREGYYWSSCAARGVPELGKVCSNTTWYPGYPYLVKIGTWLGLPLGTSAVFLSVAFWVATVVAAWVWFLRDAPRVRASSCVVLAAGFPGVVYLQALFPISMLTFLMVVYVRLMTRQRWWAGAAVAAVAGFVYPIGFVLVPSTVVWMLLVPGRPVRPRAVLAAAGAGVLAFAGTLAVFAIHQIEVGDWAASLRMQERLGTTLLNPVESWLHIVVWRDSWIQTVPDNVPTIAGPIAHQTLLVAVIVLAVTAVVGWSARRFTAARRSDLALLVMCWGLWLLPLSSFIDTGIYRREATVLPVVILVRRLPTAVTVALAVAALLVAWEISPHFFDNLLI